MRQTVRQFCTEHNVSRATMYRLIKLGILPALRNPASGRGIRVDPEKVLKILEKPVATEPKSAA